MNGFLLVNKEKGYSSNEIVQKIKKKFSLNKVGHLGTLDPDAEGLLIIAINRATKFSNYFLNSDKSYYVEIKLGKSTTTDDVSGEIIEEFEVKCSEDEVKKKEKIIQEYTDKNINIIDDKVISKEKDIMTI